MPCSAQQKSCTLSIRQRACLGRTDVTASRRNGAGYSLLLPLSYSLTGAMSTTFFAKKACISLLHMLLCLSVQQYVCAPLAQLDRASGYGPEGRGFESLTAYQEREARKHLMLKCLWVFLLSYYGYLHKILPITDKMMSEFQYEKSRYTIAAYRDMIKSVLNFTVHCPRDPESLYSMRLVFGRVPGCQPVALPCGGCEYARETVICWRCRGAINEMFYQNPELPIRGGVVPEYSRHIHYNASCSTSADTSYLPLTMSQCNAFISSRNTVILNKKTGIADIYLLCRASQNDKYFLCVN